MDRKFNVNGKYPREVRMVIPEEIMRFLRERVLRYHGGKTKNNMIDGLANDLEDTLRDEQSLDWLDRQNRPVYTASFFAYTICFDPSAGHDAGSESLLQIELPDDFKIRRGRKWNLNQLDVGIENVIGEGNMKYGCDRNFKINVEVYDKR